MKRSGPCGEGKARPVGIVFHSAVVAAQGAEVFEKRVEAVQGQSVGGLADGFFSPGGGGGFGRGHGVAPPAGMNWRRERLRG